MNPECLEGWGDEQPKRHDFSHDRVTHNKIR